MSNPIPLLRVCRRLCAAATLLVPLLLACGAATSILATPANAAGATDPQQANVAPAQGGAGQPSDYRLGSGDRLRITVFGQPGMSGEYQVDGKGTLSFPLIGTVQAGGQTASQVATAIANRLQPDYLKNPNISIEVLSYRPFYIVGEVKTPGSYPYVSGMSVINAVALAGGYTYRARDDSFYIMRTGGDGQKQELRATAETTVQPGDVITVRERYF